jgi:hypothetical protein
MTDTSATSKANSANSLKKEFENFQLDSESTTQSNYVENGSKKKKKRNSYLKPDEKKIQEIINLVVKNNEDFLLVSKITGYTTKQVKRWYSFRGKRQGISGRKVNYPDLISFIQMEYFDKGQRSKKHLKHDCKILLAKEGIFDFKLSDGFFHRLKMIYGIKFRFSKKNDPSC